MRDVARPGNWNVISVVIGDRIGDTSCLLVPVLNHCALESKSQFTLSKFQEGWGGFPLQKRKGHHSAYYSTCCHSFGSHMVVQSIVLWRLSRYEVCAKKGHHLGRVKEAQPEAQSINE